MEQSATDLQTKAGNPVLQMSSCPINKFINKQIMKPHKLFTRIRCWLFRLPCHNWPPYLSRIGRRWDCLLYQIVQTATSPQGTTTPPRSKKISFSDTPYPEVDDHSAFRVDHAISNLCHREIFNQINGSVNHNQKTP